jgi:hypothetical protein
LKKGDLGTSEEKEFMANAISPGWSENPEMQAFSIEATPQPVLLSEDNGFP